MTNEEKNRLVEDIANTLKQQMRSQGMIFAWPSYGGPVGVELDHEATTAFLRNCARNVLQLIVVHDDCQTLLRDSTP